MIDIAFAAPHEVLHDAYAVHASLDETFGRRSGTGYLWGMRSSPAGDAAMVLVRSEVQPPGTEPVFAVPTFVPAEGTTFAFAVTACPTRKSAATGKRLPFDADNVDGRRRWFERRAQAAGFEIDEVRLRFEQRWIGKPIEGRDGRPFWIDATTYAGRARVTDTEAFRTMLANGFGPQRAWGCGLFVATPA